MEVKSIRLEKEMCFIKGKKQKLGQHQGKDMSVIRKNQAQPTKQ